MNARILKHGLSLRVLCVAGLAVVVMGLAGARAAQAFTAEATWRPVSGVKGYKIYIGYDADLIGTPIDIGRPLPQPDGIIHTQLNGLTVGPTVHFSVTSYRLDGTQSLFSNGRTLTYAQVAAVVDSDADGLTDAQEDKNLNRKRDAGETDPKLFDTDGDGVSDGAEAEAGTNPLDPGSVALCTGPCASAIWLSAAGSVAKYSGTMTADGRYSNNSDLDTRANSLTPLQVFANSIVNDLVGTGIDTAQYNVVLPTSGTWYLWARLYYPGAPGTYQANSFFARMDAGTRRKLGNNWDKFRVWHWDGNGDIESGGPVALNLGVLAAGSHKLYIEKREVDPVQPRLDVLVLTRTANYVPNDSDAAAALGIDSGFSAEAAPFGADEPVQVDVQETPSSTPTGGTLEQPCSTHEDCEDEVACTVDRCDAASSVCVHFAFDALCDDGDVCNGDEICDEIADCRPGTPLVCDDGVICNGTETCDSGDGCVAGTPLACDDGVDCTDDQCVEALGECQYFAFDGRCDDLNGCTDDRCTASGCAYDQNTTACDDGLSCSVEDHCAAGVCGGRDACAAGFVCDAETDACKTVLGDPDDDGLRGEDDPCPMEARNLCAGPVAMDARTGSPIRINAYPGGDECGGVKIDCNGDPWMGDFGYEGTGRPLVCDLDGSSSGNCAIEGVEELFGCTSEATGDLLRCAHGAGSEGDRVTYRFDVADGRYVVNLMFAGIEADAGAGQNELEVFIEGTRVAHDLDVVRESGGSGRALLRAFVVDVRDGNGLEISMRAEEERASIGAFEVLALEK